METKFATGQRIGNYLLESFMGQGGMGSVWAATDTTTGRRSALKILHPEVRKRPDLRARFLREAVAASIVAHPAVLPISDVFEHDEIPVLVMELLEGETLRSRLDREGMLELAETARVLLPVISALTKAHASGIVHRDLKPENIFLSKTSGDDPGVRVLDFGVAKMMPSVDPSSEVITAMGSKLGTLCYMSPEQLMGVLVDARTDVWALGVMAYEMLSGCRPIEGVSRNDTMVRLMTSSIAPLSALVPDLPADVVDLVAAMLARLPDKRPGLQRAFELFSRRARV